MARPSQVTATYRPNPDEIFQVSVTAASCYPDALSQARGEAIRGVADLIAASLALYPPDVPVQADTAD